MFQSLQPLTTKTYASQQKAWLAWRSERGETALLDPSAGPVGCEDALIQHYAHFGANRHLSHKTLHVRLYAIKRLHLENGIHLDYTCMHRLRTIQRGLRNMQGESVRKLAITVDMLRDIQTNGGLDWADWDDQLTYTATLVGFFFLLRSIEYLSTEHGVDPKKTLRVEHITFRRRGALISRDGPLEADRVVILIPYSKTDALGVGVELAIDIDRGNPLCPVEAFNRLRRMEPARFSPARDQRYLFTCHNGLVLKKVRVQALLKASARRAGYNPEEFTSHSLRAGGASAMYHNGYGIDQIKRRGRWVSDVWKIYVQGLSVAREDYTKRMTTTTTLLRDQRRTGD